MVGQNELINRISKYSLDNFPHTVLFCGEKGCGKHTCSNLISEKLSIPMFDITESIDLDTITDIILSNLPSLYFIDVDCITEKNENSLLKFIEEPTKNYFVILSCSNLDVVLPTIKNRCRIFNFEPYSKDELKKFIENGNQNEEIILRIAHTPGQVISLLQNDSLNKMLEIARKLIEKCRVASYGNILNVSDKMCFKNEKDKFDLNCFCSILVYLLEDYIQDQENNNNFYFFLYECTLDLIKNLRISNLNKQYLFDRYLFTIKGKS